VSANDGFKEVTDRPPTPRVDAHTHVFAPEVVRRRDTVFARDPYFRRLYEAPRARLATAEDLVAELEASGFDAAVACGWGWTDHALCVEQNDYLIDAVRRYPGRVLGFAAVQPTAGKEAVREAERALRAGLAGIGELMPHGQGYALDQTDLLAPLAELAVALDVPILTHTSEPVGHLYPGKGEVALQTVLHLATTYPRLKLICAHWGGGLPFYELMPEVAAATANVWYDTAASPYLYQPRVYSTVRALVGAERILFGTDFPLLRIDRCAAQVRGAGLPAAEVDAILGGNAARLLGISGAPARG
jgi:predicted TIM-barrel fold metal-dependent hydrolase